jgi:hypothetical protein
MIRERTQNSRPSKLQPPRLLDARLFVLALFLLSAAVILFGTHVATNNAAAQATAQRRRPVRRRPRSSGQRAPAIDYTKFSHATKGHYENCAECHITETPGPDGAKGPKTITKDRLGPFTLTKPDLREYPDHPSCTECHRQQFFHGPFRGPAPAICADCHTAAQPRNGARFPFPKPPQQQASQFADQFPHANHGKSTSLKLFAPVMGLPKVKQQDTCFYCHKLDRSEHKPPAGAKDAFAPPAGTYMLTPTSHASCFQCHWQKDVENKDIEPLANNCADCHKNLALAAKPMPSPALTPAKPATTPAKPAATPAAKPAATPAPKAAPTPKPKPVADLAHASFMRTDWLAPISFVPAVSMEQQQMLPPRTSPKFRHELNATNPKDDPHQYRPDVQDDKGQPQKITCLACHVAVRTSTSLESLRQPENKVQLPTCASSACHTALSGPNLNLSILKELRERDKDKTFDCALCHTPPNSTSKLFPCDHYEVVYQTAVKENKVSDSLKKLIQKSPCKSIVQ